MPRTSRADLIATDMAEILKRGVTRASKSRKITQQRPKAFQMKRGSPDRKLKEIWEQWGGLGVRGVVHSEACEAKSPGT